MKHQKIFSNIIFFAISGLLAACTTKPDAASPDATPTPAINADITSGVSVTPKPDTPPHTEVSSGSSAEESALLDRLCEKAKQLYMVEPVASENGLTILVHKQIPAKTPDEMSTVGEVVAQYELPFEIAAHNAYNFYYDGEIFAVAEGARSYDNNEEGSKTLSILVSQNGGAFERIVVGETETEYDCVYFSFGENGRIALLTDSAIRHHEVFLRPDSASEWRRLGTAESFDNRYDRLADQISFFDETTGVVGTPFVDPWYTNFIRTEDAGQTWDFAEKELLENMPDSTVTEECQYAVLNLHCEGNVGAALVRVGDLEPDGSFAYYLYTTVDKGKTWQIGEKVTL
ncbi:MAG: hypothetical protein K2O03_01710 [Lachnospiraceae bacterium]|nr:hypothetical protein [Lachnospiraceae bacterium]